MNTQMIKFTADEQTKEIEVQGCFPYLINSTTGKVVLRITANEADTTFDDLHSLKDNTTGIIEYYERVVDYEGGKEVAGPWILKTTYEDYNAGEVTVSYQNGQYQCDVTRLGDYEKRVLQNEADIAYISVMADIPLV